MNNNLVKDFRNSFHSFVAEKAGWENAGKTRDEVYWFATSGDWVRPCWIEIYNYAGDFYRIRNDRGCPVPSSKWRFEKPIHGGEHRFELTFMKDELTADIFELIYRSCSDRDFQFSSPLFAEAGDVPSYAWTVRANDLAKKTGRK